MTNGLIGYHDIINVLTIKLLGVILLVKVYIASKTCHVFVAYGVTCGGQHVTYCNLFPMF